MVGTGCGGKRVTFATPSTSGTDFPITQHDSAAAGDCPQQATIGVGEGRLSHCTDEEREVLMRSRRLPFLLRSAYWSMRHRSLSRGVWVANFEGYTWN
jgi:hypothetical protein